MGLADNVRAAQLPRMLPPETPDDADSDYRVIIVDVPLRTVVPTLFQRATVPIQVAGDHLTVIGLSGPHHIGISLNKGKHYIPVREGDVLTRRFTELRAKAFCSIQPTSTNPGAKEAVAITRLTLGVSWGPLLQQATFKPGFRAGCPKFRGTATPTGVTIYGGADAPTDGFLPRTIGAWGGTIMIRNRSIGDSLFLYDGRGGDFDPLSTDGENDPLGSWEIFPGEVLVMDLHSKISGRPTIGSTVFNGPCLGTLANPVPYTVMMTSWGDASDMDDDQAGTGGATSQTDLDYASR